MKNLKYRRFLSLLLAFCLMLGMVPGALAEDAVPYAYLGETQEVHDQEGLEAAIAVAPKDGTFMNIVITENFEILKTVEIPSGIRLCISSDNTRRTIKGITSLNVKESSGSRRQGDGSFVLTIL